MAQSLRTLKGVGEKTEKLFQKVGIYDTDDLLHYYPRNYDEYETPVDIAELKEGTVQAVSAAVCSGVYVNSVRGRQIISVNIADQSGKFPVVWFNLPYLKKTLRKGSWFVFRGRIVRKQGKLEMEHPEIFTPSAYEEILHNLQPIYGLTAGLSNKTVVLGITGGIAAYKMPNVAHALVKLGADVYVLMTKNATEFISPLVFETLTRRRCQVDTFDRNFQYDVAHISLANAADLMLIAPATANVIAKLAHGQADDMLTTVTLAATCPKLVAPAMNTHMLENPITQDNLKTLEHYGFTVIPSGSGMLACGDVGSGRLPDEGVLVDYVLRELACAKDLKGKKVVVSAGATQEPMDPVRYLTNHSTGKMGYAVARACMLRGADVTLLASTGCTLPPVPFVKTVPFTTAADLFEAVKANAMDADALVMAAAVADYRPATVAADKVKKHDGEMNIALERTDDILAWVGAHKPEKLFVCGFSMETRDLIENSTAKLHKKNMDMIVANNLKVPGAGFGVDTNVVTIITAQGVTELPLQSKDAVAGHIADAIAGK